MGLGNFDIAPDNKGGRKKGSSNGTSRASDDDSTFGTRPINLEYETDAVTQEKDGEEYWEEVLDKFAPLGDPTDEQIEKMTEMHKRMARKRADMMAEMPAVRYRLDRELAKDKPDAERVGELFLQMQKQRRQLMQDRMKMRQQMMQTLTKEQRQQMMENMGQMGKGGGSGNMPMQNR